MKPFWLDCRPMTERNGYITRFLFAERLVG
jgi:hypothetical protein